MRGRNPWRIRFTKRDENGKVFQYFASYDPRDIRLVDFRGKSQEEINTTLEEWSSQPFEQVDLPMNEFIMVAMPTGTTASICASITG